MSGYLFFEPDAFYQVITHRPDTQHMSHWFETGEIVKCVDVTPIDSNRSLRGSVEFRQKTLKGLFINSKGVEQTLATGDVRKCRLV